MARCHICNDPIDKVKFDENNRIEPCSACRVVIRDTVNEFYFDCQEERLYDNDEE